MVAAETLVPEAAVAQRGFVALRVTGPIDFSVIGLLAELTGVLAAAGVPICAISTFETDTLLIPERLCADATDALAAAGWSIATRR